MNVVAMEVYSLILLPLMIIECGRKACNYKANQWVFYLLLLFLLRQISIFICMGGDRKKARGGRGVNTASNGVLVRLVTPRWKGEGRELVK